MLFEKTSNWKRYLSSGDENTLNGFLEKIGKYRPAYKNAEEVKIAQLWCGLLQLEKKTEKMDQRLKRIENILDSITQNDQKEKDELLKSLKNL